MQKDFGSGGRRSGLGDGGYGWGRERKLYTSRKCYVVKSGKRRAESGDWEGGEVAVLPRGADSELVWRQGEHVTLV